MRVWLLVPPLLVLMAYGQTLNYVSGRSSSLCALFYFGCLFLVIHAVEVRDAVPRRLWYCAAAVSGMLAWAAKEEAITLPFIVAVFLLLHGHRGKRPSSQRRSRRLFSPSNGRR